MKLLCTYTQFQDSLIQGSYLRQSITRKIKKNEKHKDSNIQSVPIPYLHIYLEPKL